MKFNLLDKMKNVLLIMLLAVFSCQLYAQNSVSIGTDQINENAVLQLVSQNNSQGFLVPRLSTAQRNAMQLSTDDNGMLIYDTDEVSFFYWQQGTWFKLLQGPEYVAGEGIQIDESHVVTNTYEADPIILNGSGAAIVTQQGNNQYNIYVSDADTLVDNEIQNLNEVLSQGNDAGNATITGLANPANNSDAATMEYVDNQISGTWSISGNNNIAAGNYIGTTNNQDLRLRTNAQNRMIIDGTNGYVSIGNNIPTTNLGIERNSGTATPMLRLDQLNTGGDAAMIFNTNGGNAFTIGIDASEQDRFKITDNTSLGGANDRFIMQSNGNIGINTNPDNHYKFYVDYTTTTNNDAAICAYVRGSGDIYGLRGGTFSNDDDAAGVHGFAGGAHGETYGVSGVTYSVDDNAAGVYGYANNIAGGRTYGVYGVSASPNGIGIYGRGSYYAGYFTGRVYATGTITQNSDKRLKKDIVDMNDAYTKLNSLRGVYFYWNTEKYPDREYSDHRQIGVIAQEVENVFPELVEEVDGYKSVNYIGLIPVLIEATKEQQKIIISQKNEIDELRSRIESIETLLHELNGDK